MGPASLTIEVVVPWRGGCQHRERAWDWLSRQWAATHPWPITVAEAPAGPWIKAAAVMPAVSRSTVDVVVVADADVWCVGLAQAVEAVSAGAPWATPHGPVHRLTAAATEQVLAGGPWPDRRGMEQVQASGHPGGGIAVVPRSTLLEAPLDARFAGWGQEDDAWALALITLAGKPWRGPAPLRHLWHPPQDRISRHTGSRAGAALLRRYQLAARNPARMRALLEET